MGYLGKAHHEKFLDGGSYDASFNSQSIDVTNYQNISVQIEWSGGSSVNGTLQLQAKVKGASTWKNIGSSQSVSADSGSLLFTLTDNPYSEIRASYTKSSGSGGTVNGWAQLN